MNFLKIALCAAWVLTAAGMTAATPSMASAHEGETDSLGCHYGRNHRDYHCHEGVFAGQSFPSRGYLVRNYNRLKGEAEKEQAGESRDD
ncbi:MAG TPA: hypothetical protein VD713_00570 [Sphingomonadales bacterium]|nr:hypothetical protein [Sphingomonadales bacterium]